MNRQTLRILTPVFTALIAVSALGQERSATLSVDGKPVVIFQIPSSAKVTSSNAYVNIRTPNLSLHVWAVTTAKTPSDAVPLAGDLIKSEFTKFKPKAVMDMTIGGVPAKHVKGSGNEADDGDPGNAEVVLFAVGNRVFAACIHGEFNDAARAHDPMMTVLKTAHAP
jgi:hypothetical protein